LYRYTKVTMDAFSGRSNPNGDAGYMGVGSPEKGNRPPKAEPKIAHQVGGCTVKQVESSC
jgi:hypothetical protein